MSNLGVALTALGFLCVILSSLTSPVPTDSPDEIPKKIRATRRILICAGILVTSGVTVWIIA